MAKQEIFEAAGFSFASKEMAELAAEEEKKAYYIRSRLNMKDAASVLVIYNKLVKQDVFKTPVGTVFLKEIHDILIKDGSLLPEEVDAVPAGASYSDLTKSAADIFSEEEKAAYEKKFKAFSWIIAIMAACVIAMFVITLKADNPNILNYETAIQNKYAAWESELREKEAELREREYELEKSEN